MAVKIRLARAGAKKRPFYRVVVADHRRPRNGKFIELIGRYDPRQEPVYFTVEDDRLNYWLSQGATPSDTVHNLIAKRRRQASAAAA